MQKQRAVMEKHFHHQMVMREESDFDNFVKIRASLQLPLDDELVCSDDEVREACAVLEGVHESLLD